jgi:hypothetical protein
MEFIVDSRKCIKKEEYSEKVERIKKEEEGEE